MIDLHSHILPALDDGPRDMDQAVAMARVAVEDGIHSLVATPHVIQGAYKNDRAGIIRAVEEFNRELASRGIDLKVYPGAEYMLDPDLPGLIGEGLALTLNDGGRYILVEFPAAGIPPYCGKVLFDISLKGITPIIAHPERNADLIRDPDLLGPLLERGAVCQVTAGSLTGLFGRKVRQVGWYYLKRGICHFIGSDAHSAGRRAPRLSGAARLAAKSLGAGAADLLARGNPGSVLIGVPLTCPTAVKDPPKSLWGGFCAMVFGGKT